MIEIFSAYIKTIVVFLIFAVFAEMIMPNNSFKKYINIILGFLMIITILVPIVNIINKDDIDFSKLIEEKETVLFNSNLKDANYYEEQQTKLVSDLYKEEVNSSIKDKVVLKDAKIISVDAKLNEDTNSNEYGQITGLDLVVSSIEQNSEFINMKPVKVFAYEGSEKIYETARKEGLDEKQIKKEVETILKIPEEKINIYIH